MFSVIGWMCEDKTLTSPWVYYINLIKSVILLAARMGGRFCKLRVSRCVKEVKIHFPCKLVNWTTLDKSVGRERGVSFTAQET